VTKRKKRSHLRLTQVITNNKNLSTVNLAASLVKLSKYKSKKLMMTLVALAV